MKQLVRVALLSLGVLALIACGGSESEKDTATGGTDTGGSGSDTAAPAGCDQCADMVGWAFRITSLFVTEPEDPDSETDHKVREFLNELWERDIDNEVLNILFEVKEYDPVAGKLVVRAGPAWKHDDGKFHMLCGYDSDFTLPMDGCGFEAEGLELNFHTGPLDAPVICAPDLELSNSIPLRAMSVKAELETDCAASDGGITGGYLSGWIPAAAADQICSCNIYDDVTKSYSCDEPPDPSEDKYCGKNCGTLGYTNFGWVVTTMAQIPPQDNAGVPSYRLAGYFSAHKVESYDPQCCTTQDCSQ